MHIYLHMYKSGAIMHTYNRNHILANLKAKTVTMILEIVTTIMSVTILLSVKYIYIYIYI